MYKPCTFQHCRQEWHAMTFLFMDSRATFFPSLCITVIRAEGSGGGLWTVMTAERRMLVKTAPTALQARVSLDSWTLTAVSNGKKKERHTFNLSPQEVDIIKFCSASKPLFKVATLCCSLLTITQRRLFYWSKNKKCCSVWAVSGLWLVNTSILRALWPVHCLKNAVLFYNVPFLLFYSYLFFTHYFVKMEFKNHIK